MVVKNWWRWLWFVGWDAAFHWYIGRRHLFFCTVGLGNGKNIGQFGGQIVKGWSFIECCWNGGFDKSKSTAFDNHDWSWDHIEGSARQRRAEMVRLHSHCVWIGTKKTPGFLIPPPASGKGVSCQQTVVGPEGFHFSSSPISLFCCFIRCMLCMWASYHLPRTLINPRHSFSKILPVHCGQSAVHWLSFQACNTFCSRRQYWVLVPNLWWFVLETGVSYCLPPQSDTGYEEFCIGNPWGKTGSGFQNCAGKASCRCIVVTKEWFIGRWQHETVNFWSDISKRLWKSVEHATYARFSIIRRTRLADRLCEPYTCQHWQHYLNDFCTFILRWLYTSVGFTSCALNGLPTGMQAQSQKSKVSQTFPSAAHVFLRIPRVS